MFISGVTNVMYKSNNVIKWNKWYIIDDVYANVSTELFDWFLKWIMELATYINITTCNLVAHWSIMYKSNNVKKWNKLYIINDVYANVFIQGIIWLVNKMNNGELVDWFLKWIMEYAMYINTNISNLVALLLISCIYLCLYFS